MKMKTYITSILFILFFLSEILGQSLVKNFEMDVQVSSNNSEWLEINIIEKPSGTVVFTTGQLSEGVDYTNGLFNFEAPLYSLTSVCKDYEVEVKTKNLCNNTIASDVFDWDRSTYCSPKPQLLIKPTAFSPNGDGVNDVLCFSGCGFDTFSFSITNQWGTEITSGVNRTTCDGKGCVWDGGNSPDDVYIVTYKLFGCGNEYEEVPYNVTLIR